jgi:hypothetical protein
VVVVLAAATVAAIDAASRRGAPGTRLALDGPEPDSSSLRESDEPSAMLQHDAAQPLSDGEAPSFTMKTFACDSRAGSSKATFELTYPVFTGPSADDINNGLAKRLCEMLEVDSTPESAAAGFFDGHARLAAETPGYSASWSFTVKTRCEAPVAGIVCVEVSHAGYSGGAHGFYGSRYVLLDALSGMSVDWKRLIVPGRMGAFVAAAERGFRAAAGIGANEDPRGAGYWFGNGAFSLEGAEIGLTRQGTVVHFNPYVIASFAAGSTTYVVPMAELVGVLDLSTDLADAGDLGAF